MSKIINGAILNSSNISKGEDMVEIKKTPDGIEIPPPGPDDVLYEKGDGFARITLNRPTVLNAMNKNVQRLLYRRAGASGGRRRGEGGNTHRSRPRLHRRR